MTPPSRMGAGALLMRALRAHRDRTALVEAGRRRTYGELDQRARRAVAALADLGVRPGEPVGLIANNVIEFCELDLACLLGGFVRCAETPRMNPHEAVGIFTTAGVSVIVVEVGYLPQLLAVRDQIVGLKHVVVIGGDGDGLPTWDELLEQASPATITTAPSGDDDAWLIFSSGTTGEPKGATLTHAGLVNMIRNVLAEVGRMDEDDVLVHSAPWGHLSGCLGLASLSRGGTQVLLPHFDATSLLRTVERHRVTYMVVVPTMLATLTDTARALGTDMSSLRTVLYGASPIAPNRLIDAIKVFGNVFVQVYGLTEVPMPMTVLPERAHRFDPEGPAPQRLRSAGRPAGAVEIRLVDDDRKDVPDGQAGEIAVRTDVRMRGYWGRTDLTAAVLDDDGWFYTGDIGRFDEDGYLYIVDRKKDMVVTGGFNVYPTEVEHVIAGLAGVGEVAVIGLPDPKWGEAVTAVVVRTDPAVTADAVVAGARGKLAAYKAPKQVRFVDALPKNARGKVLRRVLREQFAPAPAAGPP